MPEPEKPSYEELEKRLSNAHYRLKLANKRAAKANKRCAELSEKLGKANLDIRRLNLRISSTDVGKLSEKLRIAEERLDVINEVSKRGSKHNIIGDSPELTITETLY